MTDTTGRELRYGGQASLNWALAENWVLRSTVGYAEEAPRFEAWFVEETLETDIDGRWFFSLTGRWYEDTGEIDDSLLLSSAAPELETWHVGLGIRWQGEHSALKLSGGPYFTRYGALGPYTEPFQNLYRERDWGIVQLAFSTSFDRHTNQPGRVGWRPVSGQAVPGLLRHDAVAGAGQTVSGRGHGLCHAMPRPGQCRRVPHDYHAGDDAAVVPRVWAGRRCGAARGQGLGQGRRDAPAIFTFRFALGLLAAVLWAVAVLLSDLGGGEKWAWLVGALFLLVCCMDYSWLFQATEQMPRASAFSTGFLRDGQPVVHPVFQKRQAVGSDLYVLLVANAVVVGTVWWRCPANLASAVLALAPGGAGKLLREAWLIWLFNLGYYLLANMAQVMTFFIIGKESGGLFGSAQYLVLALQMFLHYFGILMALA